MPRYHLVILGAATGFALGVGAVVGASTSNSGLPCVAIAAQQAQDDEIVTVGGDVKPPKKIKHVNPVYPPEAKEAGIEGIVILEAVIGREGKVAQAKVIKSIPELDRAALDAVLQWEFEKTYLNGKAVSVRMTVTINFTLDK